MWSQILESGKGHISESGLFLTLGSGTSSDQNENLRPLLNRNIPPISGKYGLRNHFLPVESGFLMRKREKKGPITFQAPCSRFKDLHFWNRLVISENLALKKFWVFFVDLTGLQDLCVLSTFLSKFQFQPFWADFLCNMRKSCL